MRPRPQLLAVAALAALAGTLGATPQTAKKPSSSSASKKADPAGTGPYMGPLRALFADWDLNKDNYLDRKELGKGFRDLSAKASAGTPAKAGTDTDAAKKPNGVPEQQFLAQLDAN